MRMSSSPGTLILDSGCTLRSLHSRAYDLAVVVVLLCDLGGTFRTLDFHPFFFKPCFIIVVFHKSTLFDDISSELKMRLVLKMN